VLHAPGALSSGNDIPMLIGWAQSRSRHCGEAKIIDLTGTRTSPFGRPVIQDIFRAYTILEGNSTMHIHTLEDVKYLCNRILTKTLKLTLKYHSQGFK
jgi:hypothetical protein